MYLFSSNKYLHTAGSDQITGQSQPPPTCDIWMNVECYGYSDGGTSKPRNW